MAPLVVLLVSFVLVLTWHRLRGRPGDAVARSGRWALAIMFGFTGTSHFVLTAPMVGMLPAWVPARVAIVQATGALEVLGALGLLLPATRRAAAVCLLVFLVAVFPANVWAAWHGTGTGGHAAGPAYLLFRAPLQLLFLGWTWWFGLRDAAQRARRARPAPARSPA